MNLKPKQTKYRKAHKGRVANKKVITMANPNMNYVLIARENSRITDKQLSTLLSTIKKYLKKEGIVYLRTFPNIPASSKPAEVRMGKGKGGISY